MLTLYRSALRLRREHPALGSGELRWDDDARHDVLHLIREPGFSCVVNFGNESIDLPPHGEVLLASGPLPDDQLPPDTTVWLA
jgi:alpha-glucosidase